MRIGPKMHRALEIIQQTPGCPKLFVARRLHIAAAQGNNNACGYDPINRAIRAGLVDAAVTPSGYYRLRLSPAGEQVLSQE